MFRISKHYTDVTITFIHATAAKLIKTTLILFCFPLDVINSRFVQSGPYHPSSQ